MMKPEIMPSVSPDVYPQKRNTLEHLFSTIKNSPLFPFRNEKPVGTSVHVQALDEIVSVNSFFTAAVFIGITFTNPNAQGSLVSKCEASQDFVKYLLIFEVVSFSCYLCSSLIAQGLKLMIVVLNGKDHPQVISAVVNARVLRGGMILTAIGTILGTTCLTFSMVILIQIRLGLLFCKERNDWPKWGAYPVIGFVSTGLMAFISTAVYAFVT